MASPKKDLLEFEKAIEYMDPMQVTEYLSKTLDFLKRNNIELCFPNISSYTEAFLVRLVAETRNLESKSLNFVNKRVATEIIDVLKMNRDVYRWTYGYVSGKQKKNLLVYKKIYSNKLKMKPKEFKIPTSTIAQRLAKAQSQTPTDVPAGCKIKLLNMTLRFLKSDAERTLYYPEMPLTQAQYIYSLIKHPKSDLSVGFGYKSLYAPLFEALDVYGLDYVFEITFVETNSCETAALKLEKKLRKTGNDTSRDESSLNSSASSTTRLSKKQPKKKKLVNGVTTTFISKTLKRLLNFTSMDVAIVKFENLSYEELVFIRGVKSLAASTESYGNFEQFRESLKQLNSNIGEVMKTCKLRIEEGSTRKTQARFLTVKKVPRETPPVTPERAVPPITRSKSAASVRSRDRSLSRERRIQFKSAGKLDPATDNTGSSATDNKATDSVRRERGRSIDRLNARKTKLLEDMSVPLESDRGIRMMLLMGWRGGALGARGDGILEPIVPSIELPPGAGLGHVPPPKPERARAAPDFRARLLQNILDLLQGRLHEKELDFKTPLNKKERKFLSTALKAFNKRAALGLGVKVEVEMGKQISQEMAADAEILLVAEVAKDLKKITLTKSQNPSQKSLSKIITKLNKQAIKEAPITMTVLNTHLEYELITEDCIAAVIHDVIPRINTTCKTPMAIKFRATRILFLQRFIIAVESEKAVKEFRFAGTLQKRLMAFLGDVVTSVNCRVRSTHVTPEEMELFEELTRRSEGWVLTIEFVTASKFIFSKKFALREYQKRFYNSAWPHPQDNNNHVQTDNQNQHKDTWVSVRNDDDTEVIIKDNLAEENNNHDIIVIVNEDERKVNIKSVEDETVAKIETECDIETKDNEVDVTNVDKEELTVKKVTAETDDEMSNDDLCVCDNNVDISQLDKDIQELELAIFEADLNCKVKKEYDDEISPNSKRSHSNSVDSQETNTKRSKISKKSFLIISPNDPERKINTEIVQTVQARISQEIDKCTYFLPLLKCHGVQDAGLVYSCHDEKDIDWLKTVINDADLDLNVTNSVDDFCIEQKSRKMVIKLNSFIPLECKTMFKRLELYNNGLQTALWKVLAAQTYNCYVLFIVEIDENSFNYISKENFSLYVGIDKAQFSIIF